jgi:hypothetical protein
MIVEHVPKKNNQQPAFAQVNVRIDRGANRLSCGVQELSPVGDIGGASAIVNLPWNIPAVRGGAIIIHPKRTPAIPFVIPQASHTPSKPISFTIHFTSFA